MTKTVKIIVLNDLHLRTPFSETYIKQIAKKIPSDVDLLVLNGDIVDLDLCGNTKYEKACTCKSLEECKTLINEVGIKLVDTLNRPFMFSLGNHDGRKSAGIRTAFAKALSQHSLFAATKCNKSLRSCVHEKYRVATLDSGEKDCKAYFWKSSYSCPDAEDVEWIENETASWGKDGIFMLATHIAPPKANLPSSLRLAGQRHEAMRCWLGDKFGLHSTLPTTKTQLHIFGHDHNNLSSWQAESGVVYTYGLKSGQKGNAKEGSFGPSFGSPGYTEILHLENGQIKINWKTFDNSEIIITKDTYTNYGAENCTNTNEFCFTCPGWLVVYSAIVSLILILSIVLLRKKQRKRKYSGIEMTRNEKNETQLL
eukprot:g5722.t1